ncbi:50S ribosomal protein L21 [Candidatus Karelsulcia muelleri]|nr:50S ribosomal protein L21 [Candidatus Karelsulcia muelleri]WDE42161.1 50S ribosomal protein L21 [Candidatus Karelsulcia muelleri]WDR79150.1 50S ribosomal protein L21 [Candidatus Karelsulcia muelleri]
MFYFLMKAYFEALGKQYCAKPYKYIDIPFIKIEKIGQKILLKKILLFSNKEKFNIGNPYLKNLYILAKVISHYKEKKKICFKKKRRKGYKLKKGHRQNMTKIKILSIVKINGTQKGSRKF